LLANASEEVSSALIKTKCLQILFYGVEACPSDSSVRQSFEFTMNKILFKVFRAMLKDSYRFIYECFGVDNADQFISKRQDKFINKFCASDKFSLSFFCIVLPFQKVNKVV